jgi:PHP family Zn ribbon phosphoesterase
VLARVGDLADREAGVKPTGAIDYKRLVPLPEIIAEAFGVGKQSKRVMNEYHNLIIRGKNEFNILLNLSEKELSEITIPEIVEGILRVRQGQVNIQPGYDGVYGTVSVFGQAGTAASSKVKQQTLF